MTYFGIPLRHHKKNVTLVNRRFVNWRHGLHSLAYLSFGLGMSSCQLVPHYNILLFCLYILFINSLIFAANNGLSWSSSYIYIWIPYRRIRITNLFVGCALLHHPHRRQGLGLLLLIMILHRREKIINLLVPF